MAWDMVRLWASIIKNIKLSSIKKKKKKRYNLKIWQTILQSETKQSAV